MRFIDEETSAPIYLNRLDDQFVKDAVTVVRENIDNSRFNKDEFASAMPC